MIKKFIEMQDCDIMILKIQSDCSIILLLNLYGIISVQSHSTSISIVIFEKTEKYMKVKTARKICALSQKMLT
jgi:hypothetical protein